MPRRQKRRRKVEDPSYAKGTLIVADGHLVILGEQGNLGLAQATPEGFVEKGQLPPPSTVAAGRPLRWPMAASICATKAKLFASTSGSQSNEKSIRSVPSPRLMRLSSLSQDWSQWQSTGWPQWLGPDRNGISSETGLFGDKPSFEESWRVQAGRGFSGLSVVGNRIYTMYIHSGEEYAVCLDASNGEVLWRTRTDRNLPERQGGGRSARHPHRGRRDGLCLQRLRQTLRARQPDRRPAMEPRPRERIRQQEAPLGILPVAPSRRRPSPNRSWWNGRSFADSL